MKRKRRERAFSNAVDVAALRTHSDTSQRTISLSTLIKLVQEIISLACLQPILLL